MGRRVRELEQALGQRDAELAQLRQRADELGAAVERYRMQESAIAGALTKAQTAAERILLEAEEEKAAILRSAADDKLEAETEARGILEDAQRRAKLMEDDAKEKVRRTAARAEGFMAGYRASAEKLIAEFRRTATMASDQALFFADSMNALDLDEALEVTREYDHLSAISETPAQDMPDDYADPAALMRSIYAIEQRDLPEFGEQPREQAVPPSCGPAYEEAPEPVPEIEPETVPEIEPEPIPEIEPERIPEIEPEPAFAPAPAAPEGARAADPFTSWMRAQQENEPKQPGAVPLDMDDGHVWTVEEIVERTSANGNAEIDDELNAIIEDVLRGS